MAQPASTSKLDIWGLIMIPAVITLAITLVRLAGELMHGPSALFNSAPGGPWAMVGIIWLAPIFGIYFALKLAAQGDQPRSAIRAIGFPFLAIVVIYLLSFAGSMMHIQRSFYGRLLYGYTAIALAALVTWSAWPTLFRTLLAYSYAARLPVVVVMFFALWRQWGTHYDAPPPDLPEGMNLLAKYLWLGFFPQLIFWVGVTMVAGMLFGGLAAGLARLVHRAPRTVSPAESPLANSE